MASEQTAHERCSGTAVRAIAEHEVSRIGQRQHDTGARPEHHAADAHVCKRGPEHRTHGRRRAQQIFEIVPSVTFTSHRLPWIGSKQ